MKSKFILKVNSLWINIEVQNVASEVLSKHTENLKKKENDFFFYYSSTLTVTRLKLLFNSNGRYGCFVKPAGLGYCLFALNFNYSRCRTSIVKHTVLVSILSKY